MKYKIYELIHKPKLDEFGIDMNETYRLKKVWKLGMEFTYNSVEEAHDGIIKAKIRLKGKILTILPIIEIDFDGREYSPQ